MSTEIKNKLIERARNFEVLLDDVSITSLCLLTAAEEADHAKFISYNKIEDNNSEITEVQVRDLSSLATFCCAVLSCELGIYLFFLADSSPSLSI